MGQASFTLFHICCVVFSRLCFVYFIYFLFFCNFILNYFYTISCPFPSTKLQPLLEQIQPNKKSFSFISRLQIVQLSGGSRREIGSGHDGISFTKINNFRKLTPWLAPQHRRPFSEVLTNKKCFANKGEKFQF